MVKLTIEQVSRKVPVRLVNASRGKRTRAEPVAMLYEQGKIFHVRPFPDLEDQLCTWTPASGDSPDRLDAGVWGFSELFLRGGWSSLADGQFSLVA
jgi:phage terminase large subunit-like protein